MKSAQQTEPSAPQSAMTFFVTSRNPGQGANLGGLEGADMVCQSLGAAAGEGNRVWRAYLSTSAIPGVPTVNARDRVGSGPWHNFKGDLIANSIEYLHAANNINKQTALTEKGEMINGRGDQTNLHDILTGSGMDGRAIPGEADTTCGNWTKSGEGAAMVGHHDRVGLADDAASKSWNSSHLSRGCGSEALASSGGGGLVYCFAVTP
ncbi:MAG: hypothetical protein A2288_02395 [Candidatus Moranbacteria bacterium RIFOXYA12_FULL_44_15]|nr:MAG: hypothetical protein A2288_02395 [Candidatus Moranbacteria bacterium RIFOXYA12_FULL_44_15]OGI34326.1 MAG: hypothetical protein A2259_03270 [Candidatus Moranbacteria bacterium RIFOXYA2_FULL_43_15]